MVKTARSVLILGFTFFLADLLMIYMLGDAARKWAENRMKEEAIKKLHKYGVQSATEDDFRRCR